MVTTRVAGTIPILGITTKEVGVATRVVAMGVAMAVGAGVTRTLVTTTNKVTVVAQQETNNMVITAPNPTTWTRVVAVAAAAATEATTMEEAKVAEGADFKMYV